MIALRPILFSLLVLIGSAAMAEPLKYSDPNPQQYKLKARASEIDATAKEYPEIGYVFGSDDKPQDMQNAIVDTTVAPQGKLVIWLMGNNGALMDRLSGYGLHAIQVHYARQWFGKICQENPVGEHCRGNARLEATTGDDYSDQMDLQKQDGMVQRALKFVKHLAKENPQGGWDYFLTEDGNDLRWDDVIVAGASHGSTSAARFAKHQKVSRVVMFCGPRDQYQSWQSLPSATPSNRYFGFTHVLDGGWTADHYCRSWEMLGLHEHGAIVDVDKVAPPFEDTRRLVTNFDVGGNANRAHSSVTPGSSAGKDKEGKYLHEAVWRYLFLHPVDETGDAVPQDENCRKDQR